MRSGPRPTEVAGDGADKASVRQSGRCVEENRHRRLLIEFRGAEELDVTDESSEICNPVHASALQVGPQGFPLVGVHNGTISRPSGANGRVRPYLGKSSVEAGEQFGAEPLRRELRLDVGTDPGAILRSLSEGRTPPGPMQVFGRS